MAPSDRPQISPVRRFFTEFLFSHISSFVQIGVLMLLSVALQLPGPILTMYVIDHVLPRHDAPLLGRVLAAFIGLIAARYVFTLINETVTLHVKEKIILDVQRSLIAHVQRLPLAFFSERQSSYLQSRVMGDARSIDGALVRSVVALVLNCLLFAAGMVFVAVMQVRIGIILLLCLVPFAAIRYYANERMKLLSRDLQEITAQASACVAERFAGNRLLKTYLQESCQDGVMLRYLEQLRSKYIATNMFGIASSVGTGFVAGICAALILYYGSMQVIAGKMSVGQIVAILSMLSFVFQPISEFIAANLKFQQSASAIKRIYEFLSLPPERTTGSLLSPDVQGRLEYRNVCFAYRGGSPVLDDVSFVIEPGAHVAIVGKTGAGKTTLVNLLLGFYSPVSGSVLIDGADVAGLRLSSIRQHIGVVDQVPFLFSGSISENVLMGRPNATRDEVVEACVKASADEFISRLPAGYDTPVGERGVQLSGGQCQKIALARIFLKDPRLLVLDEAVSSIDSQSESAIQDVLKNLIAGRTTLIIAHRLSSVMLADEVIVIEGGRVMERGSHEVLHRRNGTYAALFSDQFEISRSSNCAPQGMFTTV